MILVVLFLSLLQTPVQSPPRDARPSLTSGTGILRGIVVDEPTGAPIAGARVTIRAGSAGFDALVPGFNAATTTDDTGSFEFAGLPAGKFTVSAGPGEFRSTHLSTTLGHEGKDPVFGLPSLELATGEVRKDVRVTLKRALALEGRVSNEFGEPMALVGISVTHDDGRIAASETATDDLGGFRLFGLREGRYTVCASPSARWDQRGSSGEGLRVRYNRVCAASVELTHRGGTPAIEIHLHRVGAFTLSGSVVSGTGRSVRNPRVQVIPRERNGFTPNVPAEVSGEQFVARGLVPGEYAVIASIAEQGNPSEAERVAMTVHVDGGDVSGLVLTTAPPGSIKGRITPAQRAPALPRSTITVRLLRPLGDRSDVSSDLSDVIADDGTFSLSRIFGPQVVTVSGLAPDWFVASVLHGGEDITDQPREFRPDDEREVVIVVSDRSAALRVRPVDADGKRRDDAFIVLIPADARRWKAPPFAPFPPTLDEHGYCQMRGRRPGEYFVAAIPTSQLHRSPWGIEPLESFARVGRRITLVDGKTLTIDLPVTPLEGRR